MKATLTLALIMLVLAALAPPPAQAGYAVDPPAEIAKAQPWPGTIEIAHTSPVTKEHYLQTADQFFAGVLRNAEYWSKQPKAYPNMSFNLGNAAWLAYYYMLQGKEEYATLAVKCLEHAHQLIVEPQTDTRNTAPGWLDVVDMYFIEQRLAKSPAYTDTQRQWIRAIALKACPSFIARPEYGAMNRSFHAALAGEALLKLLPNAPDADKWREYKEKIWNYWWQFRDQDESTDHYTALWFRYLLQWIAIRGNEKEFWADPGIKKLWERYLYHVFPMGAFPHYSDSSGWNVTWGHWIWIFEAAATHWKDGRYKWAAHRLYDYGINRIEKLGSWGYTGEEAGWSMLQAYRLADDTVAEKPREFDILTTMRHKGVRRTQAEVQATGQYLDLLPELVPDKLIFYGGSDPDALSLMVDVVGDAGHSHGRRPHVIALADRQSVLLMSLGYMERRAEDHNLPLLADYEGFPYDNTQYHLKSNNNLLKEAKAVDLGAVGYGRVVVDNFQGYPATLLREIVFVKKAGVVIKDSLTLNTDQRMRWSPLWRVGNVGPDYGENWINTYLGEWIALRGLGRNAPVYTRWRNSPRDLLIYFLPDPEGKLELVDERETDSTSPIPIRVQYTLREDLQANRPVAATTVLIPHGPGPAGTLAQSVRVLLDDPLRTVLEFVDDEGTKNVVVINGSGAALRAGGLSTDAQVACIRHVGGKVSAVARQGGKSLLFAGTELAKQAPAAKENRVPVE